jgi:hypothetical protein
MQVKKKVVFAWHRRKKALQKSFFEIVPTNEARSQRMLQLHRVKRAAAQAGAGKEQGGAGDDIDNAAGDDIDNAAVDDVDDVSGSDVDVSRSDVNVSRSDVNVSSSDDNVSSSEDDDSSDSSSDSD